MQVLDNLLANALDAAPPGTRVVMRADAVRAGGWVELHVLDQGPGLSEEDRVRAFDRFWRGRPPGLARNGGSGLGLSIVPAWSSPTAARWSWRPGPVEAPTPSSVSPGPRTPGPWEVGPRRQTTGGSVSSVFADVAAWLDSNSTALNPRRASRC